MENGWDFCQNAVLFWLICIFAQFYYLSIVQARECPPPPFVYHGKAVDFNPTPFEPLTRIYRYPLNSQITYQCSPGYEIEGNEILTCTSNGCWAPSEPPTCRYTAQYFSKYINTLFWKKINKSMYFSGS